MKTFVVVSVDNDEMQTLFDLVPAKSAKSAEKKVEKSSRRWYSVVSEVYELSYFLEMVQDWKNQAPEKVAHEWNHFAKTGEYPDN